MYVEAPRLPTCRMGSKGLNSVARSMGSTFRKFVASPRARILFWAAMVALVFGAIEAGRPLDQGLRIARDMVRAHAADGSIVVVEINSTSQRQIDVLGARRAIDGAVAEQLFRLGARRVFFDKVYADPSPSGDDAAMANILRRYRGRAFLATRFEENRKTGELDPLFPVDTLRGAVDLGSINVLRDSLGYTSRIPFASEIAGQHYPSFSSLLARIDPPSAQTFAPDFSIQVSTVPTVNVVDVLKASPTASRVRGHDVIVAKTADSLGDTHIVPGQGAISGVYLHVIGAETLKRGIPVNTGWIPLYLLSLLVVFAYVSFNRPALRAVLATGTLVTLLAGPLVLDARHIEAEVSPALLLLGIVVVRSRMLARAESNPLTGLPTLDSILRDGSTCADTLVGIRIGNYADLRATLNDAEERVLLGEIVRRLRISGDPAELMHSGDTFVWKTSLEVGVLLFEHIEGLHALLSSPVGLGGRMVDLTIGFGIEDGRDRPLTQRVASLKVSADEALATGSKWRLHDPERLRDAEFRQSLLSRLDLALANGEIWVAYQPKLDLHHKRLAGAEALVRWTHPDRGVISPDQFIPVAEQANRIAGLTFFVLETAIRDARRLEVIDARFTVAVNLSVRMLAQPDLPAEICALLAKHGVSPDRLTLEITESEPIDPQGVAIEALRALRATGIHISIDDYGTGFSTLDYVRQLPASEIKIDRRFVGNIHTDRNARILAQSTIEMAHSLGLSVVAEGVERPETVDALNELGCDIAQGFLIGRPIRFAELERFLSATKLRRVA